MIGNRTMSSMGGRARNEFMANIRRIAMEFRDGGSALELMNEVVESIQKYDRKMPNNGDK